LGGAGEVPATGEGFNILESLKRIIEEKKLPPKQLKAVYEFYNVLNDISDFAKKKNLRDIVKYIIKKIKYEDYLKEFSSSKTGDFENFEDRMENLKELLTVTSKYEDLPGEEGISRLTEEITLFQNTDKMQADKSRITLMTIHAAKGLEFPIVFIVGMEEGLFPHSKTIINPNELEEERRLCYVATTRAKEHLFLTYTKFRNIFGSHSINLPSRFISEIPSDLTNHTTISDYGLDDEEDIIRY